MLNISLLKPEWIAGWQELTAEEQAEVLRLISDDTGLSRYCPHEPTEKQWEFLNNNELEVFYGGSAAGG